MTTKDRDQDIFNRVWNGLKSQNFEQAVAVSMWGKSVCVYRAADGKKCAAGHLIPDHMYRSDMEGGNIKNFECFRDLDNESMALIQELQRRHDATSDPIEMKKGLQKIATEHDLTVPE